MSHINISSKKRVVTISGGELQVLLFDLTVSDDLNATGSVYVTGGSLVTTNKIVLSDFAAGLGRLDLSNGSVFHGSRRGDARSRWWIIFA